MFLNLCVIYSVLHRFYPDQPVTRKPKKQKPETETNPSPRENRKLNAEKQKF